MAGWGERKELTVAFDVGDDGRLKGAMKRVAGMFEKRLEQTTRIEAAVARVNDDVDGEGAGVCDLVIEAIIENADIKKKLERACITARDSEPFQRIVKNTFQPSDYFADSAGFAANLAKDVEDKRRLLTALGMAKN